MPLLHLQTLVMVAAAWTTRSGTCIAHTGQNTALHKGKNYNVGSKVIIVLLLSTLGIWMVDNCKKTCNKCKCNCCSYKVVLFIILFSFAVPLINLSHAYALTALSISVESNIVKTQLNSAQLNSSWFDHIMDSNPPPRQTFRPLTDHP